MPVHFSLEVEGIPAFKRSFNRVAEDFKDFRPIWVEVAKDFREIETRLFDSKGATGASGPWAPVSLNYGKWKAKRYPAGYAAGPMHRTFATRNALTKGGAGAVYQSSADELVMGTGLPYPKYHSKPHGRRPARKVIDVTEKDQRGIQKTIQGQLLKSVTRAGFDVGRFEQMRGFSSL